MIIKQLTLTQFRCFQQQTFTFDGRIVVIEGPNGSGKSSLLEALHYCCYLRSFRTHLNRDLVQLGHDYFFAHVDFEQELLGTRDAIQIGFAQAQGKVVKCNQKPVQSYKELISSYRVVTLAADDIALIQGAPEYRRDFLNFALLLHDPSLMTLFKRYQQILDHRNSLLLQRIPSEQEFDIWTFKLWEEAQEIRRHRIAYLQSLEERVNLLLANYFSVTDAHLSAAFTYTTKNIHEGESFDAFWQRFKASPQGLQERDFKRSFFGAHLDDFHITFQSRRARIYASRGQQKLLVLLIKIAQLQQLSMQGEPGVLLLDDFMTDFDHTRVEQSIAALKSLQFQMFLSTPVDPQSFLRCLSPHEVCHIRVS